MKCTSTIFMMQPGILLLPWTHEIKKKLIPWSAVFYR